jgi:hypothetical protein
MLSHSEVLFALQSAWYEHNYVAIPAIFGTAMGLVFFLKKNSDGTFRRTGIRCGSSCGPLYAYLEATSKYLTDFFPVLILLPLSQITGTRNALDRVNRGYRFLLLAYWCDPQLDRKFIDLRASLLRA